MRGQRKCRASFHHIALAVTNPSTMDPLVDVDLGEAGCTQLNVLLLLGTLGILAADLCRSMLRWQAQQRA